MTPKFFFGLLAVTAVLAIAGLTTVEFRPGIPNPLLAAFYIGILVICVGGVGWVLFWFMEDPIRVPRALLRWTHAGATLEALVHLHSWLSHRIIDKVRAGKTPVVRCVCTDCLAVAIPVAPKDYALCPDCETFGCGCGEC